MSYTVLFTLEHCAKIFRQAAIFVISILMSCKPSSQLPESVSLRGCTNTPSCVTVIIQNFVENAGVQHLLVCSNEASKSDGCLNHMNSLIILYKMNISSHLRLGKNTLDIKTCNTCSAKGISSI